MKQGILTQFSDELSAVVKQVRSRLVHIGGDVSYRTGIRLDDGLIVTTAFSAEEGEEVEFLDSENRAGTAKVEAFDGTENLVLLKTGDASVDGGWEGGEPALGALAVTVAFPSPEGPEASLDAVRCVAGEYFQTDGRAFPGFSGAAVVSTEGKLLGMVQVNASGNDGQNLPFSRLMALVERLKSKGSRKRRVLGVRTHPVTEGLLIVDVVEGSAAEKAGLLVGDLILKLNATAMEGPAALYKGLEESEGEVTLALKRGGAAMTVKIMPVEQAAVSGSAMEPERLLRPMIRLRYTAAIQKDWMDEVLELVGGRPAAPDDLIWGSFTGNRPPEDWPLGRGRWILSADLPLRAGNLPGGLDLRAFSRGLLII